MIELFLELNRLKDVKRFAVYHPIFHETVAEHTFHMAIIADRLFDELDLGDLDYRRVMKLIFYHDVCELGMGNDFDGMTADNNSEYKAQKTRAEDATIKALAKKHGKYIIDLHKEYKAQKTEEAKFVKALDKLQCAIHELDRGAGFSQSTPEQLEYAATWATKHIQNFPKLKPIYRDLQERLKKLFKSQNFYWNDDWFIV